MRTIGAAEFKEQCLALLDQLGSEGLVVTKQGKLVARVIPYGQISENLPGSLKHKIDVGGDTFTIDIRWNAAAES